MTDFHQEGVFTTIHDLYTTFDTEEYLIYLENKLSEYSRHLKISLLLPSLFSEIGNPEVLDRIITEISKVNYLHSVVVALGGAPDEEQFQTAREYFGALGSPDREVKVVWVDGPRVKKIFREIQNRDIPTGVQGKGQSVWIALGYLFAREECDVIALHDCDIVTYDRLLLARLVEPVANPNNEFEFSKGFYARVSPVERMMKGRVTRLFVVPFADAMRSIMQAHNHSELARFFTYHRTFKYPLAGEFSFSSRLGRGINIAYDWALEVSTLSEVYNKVHPRKIAQIDLTSNYEHKHQELSSEDNRKGLHRMVVDIARFYFFYIRSSGVPLDDAFIDMIRHTYYQNGLKFIKSYSDDSDANGLSYDRHEEEVMLRHFRDFLWTAWEQSKGQTESSLIPAWNRVLFSAPNIYELLVEAVGADNR